MPRESVMQEVPTRLLREKERQSLLQEARSNPGRVLGGIIPLIHVLSDCRIEMCRLLLHHDERQGERFRPACLILRECRHVKTFDFLNYYASQPQHDRRQLL